MRRLDAMTFGARVRVAAWLVVLLSGCGAMELGSASDESDSSANLCETDADCATGHCSDGTCVSTETVLEEVAIEVIGPASVSAGEYQQMRFLRTTKLASAGQMDLSLDYVADLVVGAFAPASSCTYGTEDSASRLSVSVVALQNPGVNGIEPLSYTGASVTDASDNYVTLRVPPGQVDLYLEPSDEQAAEGGADECVLVPYLALGQQIEAGRVLFEERLPVAEKLSVDIQVPLDGEGASPLTGFVVDLVEPTMERRISSRVTLEEGATDSSGVAHHRINLFYQPVVGTGADDLRGRELFRFTPPEERLAPTFYVARVAADLFDDGQISIDQVTAVPPAVTVTGKIEVEESGAPAAAQVTAILRSTEDSSSSAIQRFSASVSSDEEGKFQLSLVAGTYDVVATPLEESRYASRVGEWTVPGDSALEGMDLLLPGMSWLTGRVEGNAEQLGEWSMNVVAVPSTIGEPTTFVEALLGTRSTLGRRSQSIPVESDGSFELGVDSGNYDVFVRPAAESGYPWFVRPNTVVTEGPVGLGAIQLSAPFVFSGLVRVPGESESGSALVLPGALIRAYALLGADGRLVGDLSSASYAVQVAEARASSQGEYSLLLPASLN